MDNALLKIIYDRRTHYQPHSSSRIAVQYVYALTDDATPAKPKNGAYAALRWEMTRSTIQSALLNSIGTAQVFSEHLRGHNAVDILRDAVAVPVGMRTRCCKDHKPCKGNKWCGKVTSKRNLLLSRQSQPHLEYEHIRPSYHARLLSKPSKTIDLSSPCGDRPNCEHLAKKDHWILRQNDNNVKTATDIKSIYYILPLLRSTSVSEQSGRNVSSVRTYSIPKVKETHEVFEQQT